MTIYKVEFKGWEREYYFSTLTLARDFAERYREAGYKNYSLQPITVREGVN